MKKKSPRLIEPIETIDELEEFLHGLATVFLSDKDGWAMIPSSYGDMFVSVEPGYYGHVSDKMAARRRTIAFVIFVPLFRR